MFNSGDRIVCINAGCCSKIVNGEVYTVSQLCPKYDRNEDGVILVEVPREIYFCNRFELAKKQKKRKVIYV